MLAEEEEEELEIEEVPESFRWSDGGDLLNKIKKI